MGKRDSGKAKTSKSTKVMRVVMMLLTVLMMVLFMVIMVLVGKIQGTARVVNYAGLVRGGTQRAMKLEVAGQGNDQVIARVSSYIDGLRFGSEELNLVRLDDAAYQEKMTELSEYFEQLKAEVARVRELGYEKTDIIDMSEKFFGICDEAVGLAEEYSQKKASALDRMEKIVLVDMAGLIAIIAVELFKALKTAAQNRLLQSKVYLDEATGLPNKNKCEELLNAEEPPEAGTALIVFDLNNLRVINNNLGHEMGDRYIRSFAEQLRLAVPAEQFVGRDGGDEFLAVLHGVDHQGVRDCLESIRRQCAAYSEEHSQMPISYAAGYALADEFPGSTMRELFASADKNMYVDKNRAKLLEAEKERRLNEQLLERVKAAGYEFTDCLYCDAGLDQYRCLRSRESFFLAEDGNYSGAVEQLVQELCADKERRSMWAALQLSGLGETLREANPKLEISYQGSGADQSGRGRLTVLFVDAYADGTLHHFLIGLEPFHDREEAAVNERLPLTRYYEQLKQSILENGNYVDALLETAEAVYTVDLTNDRLEKTFYQDKTKEDFRIEQELPCSYNEYAALRSSLVTEDTLENYRIVDSTEKLLERYRTGAKQVTVEYQEKGADGRLIWLQKTVLMSRDMLYDRALEQELPVIHGIILYKDTSEFHEKEEEKREKLEAAFNEADSASRAKTEFLNRMSHDIRTPINGVMGMVNIIEKNIDNTGKVEECLDKIRVSSEHLLALVNDVLDMSKLEAGSFQLEEVPFDLVSLMDEVAALVEAQLQETGITHHSHRGTLEHTMLIGSPLHLRQIMLNLLSNAIKYNKPDGSVDTYAGELSCVDGTAWYEFWIRDTGIGMSREFVEKELFEPFTQEKNDARTQYKGTGLGTSIVKQLVDQMGGTLQVESALGVGTTYVFRLPFQIDPDAEKKQDGYSPAVNERSVPELSENEYSLAGIQVLLAEDNEINMEVAEFYLTDHGAVVTKAWNGKEAVEQFQASREGQFRVILMDVMMPVMDGMEAAKTIRSLKRADAKTVPIYAMTARTSSGAEQEYEAAGMNGYVPKPVKPEQLAQVVCSAAGGSEG